MPFGLPAFWRRPQVQVPCAEERPLEVRQLALGYDTSAGNVETPAVQLLVDGPDPSTPRASLKVVGRSGLMGAFGVFADHMPPERHACYAGVFPGRDAADIGPWLLAQVVSKGRAFPNGWLSIDLKGIIGKFTVKRKGLAEGMLATYFDSYVETHLMRDPRLPF